MPSTPILDFSLQPKQWELMRMMEDPAGPVVIGIGGSKGSAKTHAESAVMLARRFKYPGTDGLMFRRKWNQLRDTILEGVFFRQWPITRDWWRASEKTMYIPTNPVSRIVFGFAEHESDIDDFQGKGFMDVNVDEATRCTEMMLIKLNETRRWTGKVRGKAIPDRLCKTLWGMNPGGLSHSFIRRLMHKKDYHSKERAEDYAFIPSYAWDNVEWCRTALLERHLCQCDYYGCLNDCGRRVVEFGGACTFGHATARPGFTDKERFEFFIKHTQRGHELDNLPQRLRTGWLLGNWDEFAGQFYDIWDPAKFVKRCVPDRDWHPRWLGIDWGFQHPMSCHWGSQVGPKTVIYRELVSNHHSARSQAQEIVDRTDERERKLIDAIYLSPDAFQKRSEQDSFAAQMGEIFVSNGMPYPTEADNSRAHGAQAMYELMKSANLEIDPSCVKLIDTIPMITTEEDDPEEIEKFDGDDAWDSARYLIKSRQRPGKKPVGEVVQEMVIAFAKSRGMEVENMDINTIAGLNRRATAAEKVRMGRRRGGLGRIWRPRTAGGVA
jgi:phage terminase large subunit